MNLHCKRYACLFFGLTVFFLLNRCFAQTENEKKARELWSWYAGQVNLPDTVLTCSLNYSDWDLKLMYRPADQTNTMKTVTASTVLGFRYFDNTEHHQRVFVSIPYDVKENGTVVPIFFEVLKEYPHFAIVSGKYTLEVAKTTNLFAMRYRTPSSSNSTFQRKEVICIFDDQGSMRPYLACTWSNNKWIAQNPKQVVLNRDLLRQYLSQDYYELKEFATRNNLSFEKREDLLTIFDHFDKVHAK
jgi:hypothetical protein